MAKKKILMMDESDHHCITCQHLRHFTDPGFFIIFIAAMIGLGYMQDYAYSHGDTKTLFHGYDWNGTICGVHDVDRPYLYWCVTDAMQVTSGICVKKCPTDSSHSSKCPTHTIQAPVGTTTGADGSVTYEYKVDIKLEEVKHVPTQPFLNMYCLPSKSTEAAKAVWESDNAGLQSGFSKMSAAANMIHDRWLFFLVVFICSVVAGFITLVLLMYTARIMVYVFVVLTTILLFILDVLAAGFLMGHWESADIFLALGEKYAQVGHVIFAVIMLLCTLVFAYMALRRHSTVEDTVETLNFTCQLIIKKWSLLFQPLIDLLLKAVTFVGFTAGFIKIVALGQMVVIPMDNKSPVSGLKRSIELENWQIRWLMYWIIASFWGVEFITAWGQFCIGYSVVVDQVRHKMKRCIVLRGYFFGILYHSGSLAFGAFILGLLRFVSTMAAVIAKTIHSEDKKVNLVGKICCCCFSCFIGCLEGIVKMVNERAYVDIALNGTNYIQACEAVMEKLKNYPADFAMVEGFTKFMRGMVLFVICGGGTSIAYKWESSSIANIESSKTGDVWATLTNASSTLTIILACLITFNVGLVFGSLMDHVSQAILYCLLEVKEAEENPQGAVPKVWMKWQKGGQAMLGGDYTPYLHK